MGLACCGTRAAVVGVPQVGARPLGLLLGVHVRAPAAGLVAERQREGESRVEQGQLRVGEDGATLGVDVAHRTTQARGAGVPRGQADRLRGSQRGHERGGLRGVALAGLHGLDAGVPDGLGRRGAVTPQVDVDGVTVADAHHLALRRGPRLDPGGGSGRRGQHDADERQGRGGARLAGPAGQCGVASGERAAGRRARRGMGSSLDVRGDGRHAAPCRVGTMSGGVAHHARSSCRAGYVKCPTSLVKHLPALPTPASSAGGRMGAVSNGRCPTPCRRFGRPRSSGGSWRCRY